MSSFALSLDAGDHPPAFFRTATRPRSSHRHHVTKRFYSSSGAISVWDSGLRRGRAKGSGRLESTIGLHQGMRLQPIWENTSIPCNDESVVELAVQPKRCISLDAIVRSQLSCERLAHASCTHATRARTARALALLHRIRHRAQPAAPRSCRSRG